MTKLLLFTKRVQNEVTVTIPTTGNLLIVEFRLKWWEQPVTVAIMVASNGDTNFLFPEIPLDE